MPESWDPDSDKASPDVHQRRTAAGIPDDEHHRPKWLLALECVDEALSWRVPAPPVLAADAGYGDAAAFRHGLSDRTIAYAVQISHTLSVLPATATRTTPAYRGRGRRAKPRYEQAAVSVKDHIIALGRRQARRITWRTGSRQQHSQPQMMSGRFVSCASCRPTPAPKISTKDKTGPSAGSPPNGHPAHRNPPATGCPPYPRPPAALTWSKPANNAGGSNTTTAS